MEPLGDGAIRPRHLGDLCEQGFLVVLAPLGGLPFLDRLPQRSSFLGEGPSALASGFVSLFATFAQPSTGATYAATSQ